MLLAAKSEHFWQDAVKMERDLMAIVPEKWWIKWSQWITWRGQKCVKADCPNCVLNDICRIAAGFSRKSSENAKNAGAALHLQTNKYFRFHYMREKPVIINPSVR